MGEKPEFEIDWKEIQNQDDRIVKLQISIGVVTSTNKLYTIQLYLTNEPVMVQENEYKQFLAKEFPYLKSLVDYIYQRIDTNNSKSDGRSIRRDCG